jgi:cytochrome c-type biogenesis protein CcmF
MGKYWVTYEGNEEDAKEKKEDETKLIYNIRFEKKDSKEEFLLRPTAFMNKEGIQAEPDSRHYWHHDVFTYVTSVADPRKNRDTSSFHNHHLTVGDSLFYSKGFIILQNLQQRDSLPPELFGADGSLYEALLKVYSQTGSTYTIASKLAYAKGEFIAIPDTLLQENLTFQLHKINPDKSIELGLKESNTVMEYITLKAYKFPFINILWLGILITATGVLMSMVRRIRLNRLQVKE